MLLFLLCPSVFDLHPDEAVPLLPAQLAVLMEVARARSGSRTVHVVHSLDFDGLVRDELV